MTQRCSRTVCFSLVIVSSLLPTILFAAEGGYVRLVGLPYEGIENLSTEGYINALFFLAISIGAFLTVGQIIYAGVIYMLSDIVTSKEQAKRKITSALLGLGIILFAVLILRTINPLLVDWSALDNVPSLTGDFSRPNPPSTPKGAGEYDNRYDAATAANNCENNETGQVKSVSETKFIVTCPLTKDPEDGESGGPQIERYDTLSEAQERAAACGGTANPIMRLGKFDVRCP